MLRFWGSVRPSLSYFFRGLTGVQCWDPFLEGSSHAVSKEAQDSEGPAARPREERRGSRRPGALGRQDLSVFAHRRAQQPSIVLSTCKVQPDGDSGPDKGRLEGAHDQISTHVLRAVTGQGLEMRKSRGGPVLLCGGRQEGEQSWLMQAQAAATCLGAREGLCMLGRKLNGLLIP